MLKREAEHVEFKTYNHVLFHRTNVYLDPKYHILDYRHNHLGSHSTPLFANQGFELESGCGHKIWFSLRVAVHAGVQYIEILNEDRSRVPGFGEMSSEFQDRALAKWRLWDKCKQGTVERQGIMVAMAMDTLEMVSGAEIWPPL